MFFQKSSAIRSGDSKGGQIKYSANKVEVTGGVARSTTISLSQMLQVQGGTNRAIVVEGGKAEGAVIEI